MQKHDLQQIIGNNLRRIRIDSGLTREQLAEKVGVSTTFYANLECGNKMMSVITLRKLADVLGVSTDALLYEERPCENIDRIQMILRTQPASLVTFSERLIQFCVDSFSQSTEKEKTTDECKV
jgi:transcriptional regulator with XRE-family HTH domain